MGNGIFITGTDTHVGKTFISALLVKALRDFGINAGYFKGVLSGGIIKEDSILPSDAMEVLEISSLKEDYKNMASYIFKKPYSPHLAAHIEAVNIDIEKILNDYREVKDKYEFLIVEGSGGVISPIKVEGEEIITLDNMIKNSGLSTLIVGRSGLGTINHTLLTINHLKSMGIDIKGIILNEYDENDIVHINNKEVIQKLTGIKKILTVPKLDKNNIDNNILISLLDIINGFNECYI